PGDVETIEIGDAVRSADALDLDGDARSELAVVHGSPPLLSVYPNLENGFGLRQDYTVGRDAQEVALVDLDGDGRVEAAVTEGRDENVAILAPSSGQPSRIEFRRGDADLSGSVNLSDALAILGALFAAASELSCEDAGDIDDNGSLNLTDPVALLGHLFASGPDPAPPGPERCGLDPTPDELACAGECR
ncbi:MAG: OB-fold domain-containing protein, partial [Actinobacteria bacterium]|nr:OB-fold domain-containing protein [Actinomycetota bacterium]